jgi:hypothetical protein
MALRSGKTTQAATGGEFFSVSKKIFLNARPAFAPGQIISYILMYEQRGLITTKAPRFSNKL